MSYDFEIALPTAPTRADFESALKRRAILEGELEIGGGALVRTSRWEFTIDGPFHCEDEDLSAELARAVLAPKYLVQVQVPYSAPARARSTARAMGKRLAKSLDGAIFDPQRDRVLFPRSGRRRTPDRGAPDECRRLECEWCFDPDRLTRAGEAFLALVADHFPEATPRRFGRFEPPQHRYSASRRSTFLDLWRSEAEALAGYFLWTSRAPVFGGSVFWPNRERVRSEGGQAAASLHVNLDGSCLETDARWRHAVMSFFEKVARTCGAFYGRAILEHLPSGEESGKRELHMQGACGERWYGIPRSSSWLTYLGASYAACLDDDARLRTAEPCVLVEPANLEAWQVLHAEIPEELYRRHTRPTPIGGCMHDTFPDLHEAPRGIDIAATQDEGDK